MNREEDAGADRKEAWLDEADPRRIPRRLLERYAVRGPRYTSYPTAPHFGPVDLGELYARWRLRNHLDPDPGLSVYVHIPFCRTLCRFCGCHTHVRKDPARAAPYVDDLVAEMEMVLQVVDPARTVRQVALGGGTPNFLRVRDMDRLLRALRALFRIHRDAELSAEIDPRTVSTRMLDLLVAHGFNRVSLGVQDFDPGVLDRIRRAQDGLMVETVVEHLRQGGCEEINFDLVYGLPGQDEHTARSTAETTVRLSPTRIALYNYAHVPWMKPHQRALERMGLPGPEQKAQIQGIVAETLVRAGYMPVGMDHFARPTDPLAQALREGTLTRNFMGYTTGRGLDLVGLGASSISGVGSTYAQDHRDLRQWREAVRQGRRPVMRGFLLSAEDELRRELILDLFCNFRVDLAELGARRGVDAEAMVAPDLPGLQPMVDDGLVEILGPVIRVTAPGRPFIRNVCMTFDRYLETDPGQRRYSRTL